MSSAATVRSWRGLWPGCVAVLTASALAFSRVHHGGRPAASAMALAALATAPLMLLRRWPLGALGTVIAANSMFIVLDQPPWPPAAGVAWLLALALCPLVLRRPWALSLAAANLIAVVIAVLVPSSVNARPWDAASTEALAVLVMWGGSETIRSRRASAVRQAQVEDEVRSLQERDAAARERTGIARELHDVVAHHVSLIAVRAGMAPYLLADSSPEVREVMGEIATEARTALEELRTVLGVMRNSTTPGTQTPQPSLADLPDLLERHRASGMAITFETTGQPKPTTGAIELCCYRLVQEALTNAARHAPSAPVRLEIEYGPSSISLALTDCGAAHSEPAAVLQPPGFGLLGMSERVAAVGGKLLAGRENGGFRVIAQIPLSQRGAAG